MVLDRGFRGHGIEPASYNRPGGTGGGCLVGFQMTADDDPYPYDWEDLATEPAAVIEAVKNNRLLLGRK